LGAVVVAVGGVPEDGSFFPLVVAISKSAGGDVKEAVSFSLGAVPDGQQVTVWTFDDAGDMVVVSVQRPAVQLRRYIYIPSRPMEIWNAGVGAVVDVGRDLLRDVFLIGLERNR